MFALTDDTGLGADSREQLQELIDIATQGMAMGSFKYKGWVVGGDANSDLTVIGHKDHGTGSCLGLLWKISSDSWMIPCSFNLSPKSRGVRDPKFDINSLSDMSRFLDSFELSKRALLRYISSWYDPLHLFGQIRAYLTLIYRRAIKTIPGQHWESAVTPEIYADLLKVTKMMFELKDFEVKRFCFEGIIGKKIELIGVSDGSDLLAAGRIFVRYRTGENTHGCKYLFGNVLLIGTGDESSVRCECHAFFMTVTMLTLAKELIKNYTIENIYIVSDSQITLSGVCSLTARQKLYYRQRNGFSRSQIEKLEIQILYCPGEFSDGDIFTKIRKDNLNGALTESYWNSIFFEKSKKEWPTKEYKYDPAHVGTQILDPGLTVCVLKTGIYQDGNWILNRIVLRFSLFSSMIKCLAHLFLWKREETLHSAMEKARLTLLRSVKIGEDVVSGLRRSFRVVKNDGLWFVLPRAYMEEGNETQQKLILVDGHSYIGQSIIRMLHTHVAAVGREISKMYKLGIYVTKNRHLFKKMQDNCYTCRRVRRQNLETIMGASHVDQASRNVGSMVICHFDPVGPMKLDLGGGILGKLFILSICCIFSRYLRLIPLADMTASSIVKAVRIAAFQTGGVCPQILFCDSASNLKALMSFEEDKENIKEGEDLEKTVDNLKRVFHSNGISLRPAPAKSSWRSGGIESQQKLFKTALKRSNLYHQKLKMQDWLYTLARIENEINSRGICLSYMEETFTMVTPQNILFGSRKNDLPRDINLDDRNDDLFGAVKKVDQQIDQWMNIYHRTYALEIKKFFKWKQKKTLDKKDVCYILDRLTEAGTFTLGVVTDILSNRTYELQYIKKAARVDKKTYKITKTARKSKLIRPINQLTFICKESECTNVNIDIFSSDAMDQSRPDNENLDQQVTDEIMEEEEIFMEDPEVNKDVDHELDDMIVAAEPKEVTDEIIKEDDGVNQLEENGEVIVHDKQDIVTVEDEVVVEEPQEIRDMENQDTNVDKLDKEKSNKSIAVQFAGDEEIKDIVTNPRAQGGSAKGQGKRKKEEENELVKLIFWKNINRGWGVFEKTTTRGADGPGRAADVSSLPGSQFLSGSESFNFSTLMLFLT